jgi:hypothetical protein
MKSKDEVHDFLSEPVPPSGTPEWRTWKESARLLGNNGSSVALQLLHFGSEPEQYASLLALRELGFEAIAEGYGPALIYKVRKLPDEEWETIVPESPPDEASPSDGHATGRK